MTEIINAKDRTAAKIKYAGLILEELRIYAKKGSGDDYERAHQEAFLFHLFGALDAFLHEINIYHELGIALNKVTLNNIQASLSTQKKVSKAFGDIKKLINDPDSWISEIQEYRNQVTHRRNMPMNFFVGGAENGEIHLKNPKTGKSIDKDYVIAFGTWSKKMEALIEELRSSY